MKVQLFTIDGRQKLAELEMPAPADVIVWGQKKPRYFVLAHEFQRENNYREAVVAFVNANKGELES